MDALNDMAAIAQLSRDEFEGVCRQHTNYAYLGNNTGLCKILSRFKIYVDTRDSGITPHLIMDGFWESWLSQQLARIIKKGDVCIDIGANMGYYSLLMAELTGNTGRTIAIEPNPHICNLLRRSQGMHTQRFSVVEAAISNKKGKAVLSIPDAYPGSATITTPHPDQWGSKSKIKVNMLTLDELVLQLGLQKVDVIKMDVEGVEPEVFEGMQGVIQNNPGLQIIIEYSPFIYNDPATFTRYLFSNFNVNMIKDVDEMERLDESAIDKLLALKDHTDLYLTKK